ncbi:hypothetical protein QBC37DRAFT_399319 [Rhypophila decipiens]|uniref:Uncharacterized protein n=1 Tax=Rhypophila decipiens TaxID=261697 RepID=A0AAN7BBA9_9PEZI|nr:hypothetical protein QBC37DRAFT_399319 [Rhypophila decipiens]
MASLLFLQGTAQKPGKTQGGHTNEAPWHSCSMELILSRQLRNERVGSWASRLSRHHWMVVTAASQTQEGKRYAAPMRVRVRGNAVRDLEAALYAVRAHLCNTATRGPVPKRMVWIRGTVVPVMGVPLVEIAENSARRCNAPTICSFSSLNLKSQEQRLKRPKDQPITSKHAKGHKQPYGALASCSSRSLTPWLAFMGLCTTQAPLRLVIHEAGAFGLISHNIRGLSRAFARSRRLSPGDDRVAEMAGIAGFPGGQIVLSVPPEPVPSCLLLSVEALAEKGDS